MHVGYHKIAQDLAGFHTGVICTTQALQAAVIPAKAGIHAANPSEMRPLTDWIPAFAAMTGVW
jgi:hypothetical protein